MKIIKSKKFDKWYKKLDITQKTQVDVRITRILISRNFGTFKQLEDIYELKFTSGLRVYYALYDELVILLLNGGNKNTKREQSRDISLAKKIYREYSNGK
ncbi:MAG: type II toxin-antitoxin system RelE/ParE family toxin [Bacteriovoracaceae bacterium]|jgi:putative addiction module killer protein|nr:addiction module killer protein [Halobacteriovoraceae bacterium]MDP7319700.1 type II toxin-antitoxin system RelE/ParE family toxin [Bacteriovoracaceae bacterium]|tara:strand:+ start:795 stop:1094 length:300 start_codon:yes stop_codon:yes gene_type:complete